jgi:hypothetical protein
MSFIVFDICILILPRFSAASGRSVKRPFFRMPRGFSSLVLSAYGAGCKSHLCIPPHGSGLLANHANERWLL